MFWKLATYKYGSQKRRLASNRELLTGGFFLTENYFKIPVTPCFYISSWFRRCPSLVFLSFIVLCRFCIPVITQIH
jgi:hypothetical protein